MLIRELVFPQITTFWRVPAELSYLSTLLQSRRRRPTAGGRYSRPRRLLVLTPVSAELVFTSCVRRSLIPPIASLPCSTIFELFYLDYVSDFLIVNRAELARQCARQRPQVVYEAQLRQHVAPVPPNTVFLLIEVLFSHKLKRLVILKIRNARDQVHVRQYQYCARIFENCEKARLIMLQLFGQPVHLRELWVLFWHRLAANLLGVRAFEELLPRPNHIVEVPLRKLNFVDHHRDLLEPRILDLREEVQVKWAIAVDFVTLVA